jgi:hypothetical protein
MSQSVKEELVQTLDRLSLDTMLAVLHFARSIEHQEPEQMTASADVSAAKAERAIAAGCGHSGDAQSSLHIDDVLYGRQGTP